MITLRYLFLIFLGLSVAQNGFGMEDPEKDKKRKRKDDQSESANKEKKAKKEGTKKPRKRAQSVEPKELPTNRDREYNFGADEEIELQNYLPSERNVIAHKLQHTNEKIQDYGRHSEESEEVASEGIDLYKETLVNTRPFLFACDNNQIDVVALWLQKGIDINCTESINGNTGLHLIIDSDRPKKFKTIKLLLNAKADHLMKNKKGLLPLHLACEKDKNVDIVQLLINDFEQKSNVNPTAKCTLLEYINHGDNKKRTPLNYALDCCKEDDIEPKLVPFLLSKGADPNIIDEKEGTVLHYVCGHITCDSSRPTLLKQMKLLLEAGANHLIANNRGELPLHVACCSEKNLELIKHLIQDFNHKINNNIMFHCSFLGTLNQDSLKPIMTFLLCLKRHKQRLPRYMIHLILASSEFALQNYLTMINGENQNPLDVARSSFLQTRDNNVHSLKIAQEYIEQFVKLLGLTPYLSEYMINSAREGHIKAGLKYLQDLMKIQPQEPVVAINNQEEHLNIDNDSGEDNNEDNDDSSGFDPINNFDDHESSEDNDASN